MGRTRIVVWRTEIQADGIHEAAREAVLRMQSDPSEGLLLVQDFEGEEPFEIEAHEVQTIMRQLELESRSTDQRAVETGGHESSFPGVANKKDMTKSSRTATAECEICNRVLPKTQLLQKTGHGSSRTYYGKDFKITGGSSSTRRVWVCETCVPLWRIVYWVPGLINWARKEAQRRLADAGNDIARSDPSPTLRSETGEGLLSAPRKLQSVQESPSPTVAEGGVKKAAVWTAMLSFIGLLAYFIHAAAIK